MVEQLRDRNFILCFLGGYNEDYYAFVHRTFLEYFCAWEFVWQFKELKTLELDDLIQIFREHWRDESWHEVLRLMAGMLNAKFTGEILEYLMGKQKSLAISFWRRSVFLKSRIEMILLLLLVNCAIELKS
jgi:predicted NACHT family NTPase